jgi:hypothetical protein
MQGARQELSGSIEFYLGLIIGLLVFNFQEATLLIKNNNNNQEARVFLAI